MMISNSSLSKSAQSVCNHIAVEHNVFHFLCMYIVNLCMKKYSLNEKNYMVLRPLEQ